MTDLLDGLLADLEAEGDQLWSTVSGLDEDGLADAHPGRRLGRRAPDRPPALDRRGRGRSPRPTRRRGTPSSLQALERPGRVRRRGRGRGGPARAGGAAGPLGTAREALATCAARAPRGPEDRRGSDRRCRRPRWRPRGSWRPGRTALDVDDALGVDPEPDRPDPARRPPRRPHPRLRVRRPRARPAGRGVPGRADRAVRRDVGWGPEDAGQTRDRLGVRLLPAGHPARSTARTPTWSPSARTPTQWLDDRAGVRRLRPGERSGRAVVTSTTLRIGNCSGFYGDRLSAMREMLDGGPLDVLTGDYLAELTMLILGRDAMKDPSLGYARTFVRQVEDCLGIALESGVKIVSNAGGLNPAGLADRLREVATGLGLDPAIAHVEGDDLRAPLGLSTGALTANAYLGGFGIAAALSARRRRRRHRPGHRRLARGRARRSRTSAGRPTSYDELAGAVVAGHVLECGTQATGGNFSGFRTLPHDRPAARLPARRDRRRRVERDHQARRHRRRGHRRHRHRAAASTRSSPRRYLGPDVTTRLDTIELAQAGPDRVAITGVRGAAPPEQLKVCVNELGGFRNTVEFVLTGLDIEAKADWVREQLTAALAAAPPARSTWSPDLAPHADADTEEAASCLLRCTVKDASRRPGRQGVHRGRGRAGAGVVPRLHDDRAARARHAVRRLPAGVRRPRRPSTHTVVHADGRREVDRRPDRVRRASRTTTRAAGPSPYPAPDGRADPADAARHVRARPLRRQGRRRQPRAVGRARRLGQVRRPGHLADQADHARSRSAS